MTDKTGADAAPLTGGPEAVVPPPPTVGQSIEQSIHKMGQAAQDAARELGSVAGKAADEAAAKIAPMADSASKSLDSTTRDLEIAASTVKQGCGDVASSVWDALSAGNFGQAGEALKAATGACADSFSASLMALTPWAN